MKWPEAYFCEINICLNWTHTCTHTHSPHAWECDYARIESQCPTTTNLSHEKKKKLRRTPPGTSFKATWLIVQFRKLLAFCLAREKGKATLDSSYAI